LWGKGPGELYSNKKGPIVLRMRRRGVRKSKDGRRLPHYREQVKNGGSFFQRFGKAMRPQAEFMQGKPSVELPGEGVVSMPEMKEKRR